MTQKSKFTRKHFFINRKLQGRYMLSFFIPMMIILVFMVITLSFAADVLISIAGNILNQDIQNLIADRLQDSQHPSNQTLALLVADIKEYAVTFNQNTHYKKAVVWSMVCVFGIGIFLVIVQIVLMTIFFSHKLAGPLYRFETICHSLVHGNYTSKIVLRKNDDMQNLATLLNEVIDTTRSRFLSIKNSASEQEREKIFKNIEL